MGRAGWHASASLSWSVEKIGRCTIDLGCKNNITSGRCAFLLRQGRNWAHAGLQSGRAPGGRGDTAQKFAAIHAYRRFRHRPTRSAALSRGRRVHLDGLGVHIRRAFFAVRGLSSTPWAWVRQMLAGLFTFGLVGGRSCIRVTPKRFGTDAALSNQMHNIGGSMGISGALSGLTMHEQFHHMWLARAINRNRPLPPEPSLARRGAQVPFHANFVSYLDVFQILGILALVVWRIALFLNLPQNRAV